MDGPAIIQVDTADHGAPIDDPTFADGGGGGASSTRSARVTSTTRSRAASGSGGATPHGGTRHGPAGTRVAAAGIAEDEEHDLAFAAMDTDGDSVAAGIARLHRQFLLDRYQLLAGGAGGVDGSMARALLEYALGRPPTDEEFAPYGTAVEVSEYKVAFEAWFGVYRTSDQVGVWCVVVVVVGGV